MNSQLEMLESEHDSANALLIGAKSELDALQLRLLDCNDDILCAALSSQIVLKRVEIDDYRRQVASAYLSLRIEREAMARLEFLQTRTKPEGKK